MRYSNESYAIGLLTSEAGQEQILDAAIFPPGTRSPKSPRSPVTASSQSIGRTRKNALDLSMLDLGTTSNQKPEDGSSLLHGGQHDQSHSSPGFSSICSTRRPQFSPDQDMVLAESRWSLRCLHNGPLLLTLPSNNMMNPGGDGSDFHILSSLRSATCPLRFSNAIPTHLLCTMLVSSKPSV